MVKNLPVNAGDSRVTLIPGSERLAGEGNGNPLQYSCLENSTDRGRLYSSWGHKKLDMTEHIHIQRKIILKYVYCWASLVIQMVKNPPAVWETWVGKVLWRRAWQPTPVFLPGESPHTEEPGRLQSMESQRAGQF